MKKILIVLASLALLLSATGCDVQSEEEIREMGQWVKTCKENGGSVYINGFGQRYCNFG